MVSISIRCGYVHDAGAEVTEVGAGGINVMTFAIKTFRAAIDRNELEAKGVEKGAGVGVWRLR